MSRSGRPPGDNPRIERLGVSQPPAGHDIFFAAVETTRMPMIVTDPYAADNPIIFANRAFQRMTGYGEAELIGRNCRLLQGRDTDPEAVRLLHEAVAEKREIALELLNYRKDGSSFWNALFVTPLFDAEGRLVYFFASQLDISRRRDAEDALIQAQKMEAIGQLTGGVAHDFNNLLQVIAGYVEILKARPAATEDPRIARAVSAIGEAAQRGATLTQQLLAFARKQDLKGRVVNIAELVVGLMPLVGSCVGANVTVSVTHGEAVPSCRLDPVQLEMAILNIVTNARDAMEGGGALSIVTAARDLSSAEAAELGLAAGCHAALEIADNGHGIDPSIARKVFEPFFTTKPVGRGTGLGLAMVYGFARQSGGGVRLESDGGGTRITLFFPQVDEPRSAPPLRSGRGLQRGRGERVLLVEDQAAVAELAETLLADLDYRVATAATAEEALARIDADDEGFDLLMSDVLMPGGMNGVDLARAVRRGPHPVPVLLVTGYADKALADASETEFSVLHKPYGREDLAAALRDLLDRLTGTG